jgi:septum formation protein
MLRSAGYNFDIYPVDIDEESLIKNFAARNNIKNVSLVLAKEKAKYISNKFSNNYIIGSDQVLIMNNKIYSKVKNIDEAKERLKNFQGKDHILSAAMSVFKNGEELFSCVGEAKLTMRPLNKEEIEKY